MTIVEQYTSEIKSICDTLISDAETFHALEPVSHLSQAKIQFTGGILGAIREAKEDKRLYKLINEPICRELSFFRYAYYLIDVTKELVEKQTEIQKLISSDNPLYYDNVKIILASVSMASDAWLRYSPDMANAGLQIGDEKNISLGLSVDYYTKTEMKKMALPDGISISVNEPKKNSGCLGSLLFIIGIPIILLLL